jgi:ribosomal protein S8
MNKKKIIVFFSILKFAFVGNFSNFVIPYSLCNLKILHLLVKEGFFYSFEFISLNQILVWFKYNQFGKRIFFNFISFVKRASFISLNLKQVQSVNYKNSLSTYILYTKSLGFSTVKTAESLRFGGLLICKFN